MKLSKPRTEFETAKYRSKIHTSQNGAVQDKKNQCDINRIMKRAKKNGILPNFQNRELVFGDWTGVPEYQEALNKTIRMENEFMSLPAEVRNQFDNDPAKLLEFVQNPENEDEAVKLKLIAPPEIKTFFQENPEGKWWVTTKNGKEIKRDPYKAPKVDSEPAQ